MSDESTGEQVVAGMEGLDALLLGRRTYYIFAVAWPGQDDGIDGGIARLFNAVPKYVASRASRHSIGRHPHLLGADVAVVVADLRDRHANVHVIGSLDFAQTLIAEGLFDRLNLWIYPILLGPGNRVFAGGAVPTNLTLLAPAITSAHGVGLSVLNASTARPRPATWPTATPASTTSASDS